jgi:hypothetical protein
MPREWSHHPRFQIIARDLGKPDSFLHTSSQLIVAAHLFRVGNWVGLTLENKHGEPNPDLYIRGVRGSKIFIEVKAPKALQWSGDGSVTPRQIESAVKRCVKDSSGQINRSHRGILAMSSSYVSPGFHTLLEREVQKALRSMGRNHKSLAAVVGLSPVLGSPGFQFSITLNSHYDGINPVATQRTISLL